MVKSTSKKLPLRFLNEMESVGISKTEIYLFSALGVGFWAVLLWLFVDRYQRIDDTEGGSANFRKRLNNLKDINIIIISFHVLTLVFTLAESYFVNRNIWISWLTIALALTAVFLNGVIVSSTITLSQEDHPFNKNVERSVASLMIQVFAICLMTAYIFKLIRSKNKIMY